MKGFLNKLLSLLNMLISTYNHKFKTNISFVITFITKNINLIQCLYTENLTTSVFNVCKTTVSLTRHPTPFLYLFFIYPHSNQHLFITKHEFGEYLALNHYRYPTLF